MRISFGDPGLELNWVEIEGIQTLNPAVLHYPLDEDVLDQWGDWLSLFEEHGINVHLEFYNDATDVERMGWKLDAKGNLAGEEARWIAGIVERFKRHRNILAPDNTTSTRGYRR